MKTPVTIVSTNGLEFCCCIGILSLDLLIIGPRARCVNMCQPMVGQVVRSVPAKYLLWGQMQTFDYECSLCLKTVLVLKLFIWSACHWAFAQRLLCLKTVALKPGPNAAPGTFHYVSMLGHPNKQDWSSINTKQTEMWRGTNGVALPHAFCPSTWPPSRRSQSCEPAPEVYRKHLSTETSEMGETKQIHFLWSKRRAPLTPDLRAWTIGFPARNLLGSRTSKAINLSSSEV